MPRLNSNSKIDPQDMRIFVALGQTRTLTEAAASLQLPLSTVSRALKRIETAAQLVLLRRGKEGSLLTSAGREYWNACCSVLEAHQAAIDVLNSHRSEPEGTLRIGAPIMFGRFVLSDILHDFQKLFPRLKIDLELYCSDLGQEPKVTHDVFLKVRTPHQSRHHLKVFPPIRQGAFASPGYLAKHSEPTHPLELNGHTCLGYNNDATTLTWNFSRRGEHLALSPNFRITVGDPDVLARLAMNSAGVTILPLWLGHAHARKERLVQIMPEWTPDPIVFCALHSGRSRLASKEGVFLKFLESILGTAKDPRCRGEDPKRFFVHNR